MAKAGAGDICAPRAVDRELRRDEHARERDRFVGGIADPRTEHRVAAVLSYGAAALYASRFDDPGARLPDARARARRARPRDEAETAQLGCRDRSKGYRGLRSGNRAQTWR